ncbi:DNA-binding CsgD family transcriptional regulator [Kribbella aluminosa]|uniref:DNA-binding CsgD family transcriptional regulator n=1 Tax=Kribbella aluminosa TaxID=416017 RepID=A0ABS4ULX1_9ACTN|nr:LuxR C-terminal-related transcriptional regulator [Kribbella aluminosa]MBP2352643.1 DNA-binding CsgD family transcriptional regulator [Kribbella aluminosa]
MGAGDRLEVLIRRCYAGLDADALRSEVLTRLKGLMTVDAAFFATVDPATVLFTSATADALLGEVTEQFLANEFGQPDVNKFTALAAARDPVNSLGHATRGDWGSSSRYADVMRPLGLGDELRAALMSNGRCWGVICLHRADAEAGFSERDIQVVRRIAPHVGEGLRRGLRADPVAPADVGPGVVVLDAELHVESMSAEAEHWLRELDPERRTELPVAVRALAEQLRRVPELPAMPSPRLRTSAGRWLVLHVSTLRTGKPSDGARTAVVIEPVSAAQLGSLLLDLHGLTPAQQRVTQLLLQGFSTRQIVERLCLSPHTVQEHVRAAYEKVGVGSRRELVAALLRGSASPG